MYPNQQFPGTMQQTGMYGMQQMQNPMAQVGVSQMQTGKYKTSLCRHYKNGNCSLGTTCHFAHGVQELRSINDPVPQNLPTIAPKVTVNNFKTVRCRYFDNGYCKNGPQCSFAHGDQDTRATQGGAGGAGQAGQAGGAMQGQMGGMNVDQSMGSYQNTLDPNVQILVMILQNLEQVFPTDQNIIQRLRLAQEYAKKQQTKDATQIILEIMESSERSQQEKQQYQTIYQNAQIYYNTYMNKPQQPTAGQAPQQQGQVGQVQQQTGTPQQPMMNQQKF